jgi:hypothetical protein
MSLPTTVRWLRVHGEPAEADVRCPTDDWVFPPRYTEGRCPICGWAATEWSQPREHDFGAWLVRIVLVAVALSALVLWLTVSVYQRN